ncbi:MAG: FliG C-terminal domain-containing protein [Phycisphaerae bacterium]
MPTGIQKATMLLSTLDPATASELLKSANPSVVKKIAREMANLKAVGGVDEEMLDGLLSEFADTLESGQQGPVDGFLKNLLENTLGEEECKDVIADVQREAIARDPFVKIRKEDAGILAAALEGEPAQVVSAVLAEINPDKSMQLLATLDGDLRDEVVQCMAFGKRIPDETRGRIAKVMEERIKELQKSDVASITSAPGKKAMDPKMAQYRKVALMIRGMGNELRIKTLENLRKEDKEAADGVARMMVLWEDINNIPDRALAEVLRGVNSKKLALALCDAEEEVVERLRANISERASAMLDEEADLLTAPKQSEIDDAREEILDALRDLNSQGFVY